MLKIIFALLALSALAQTKIDSTATKSNKELLFDEVVVFGTLKAVKRVETSVPIEFISATFLKQNPTSNVLDALQNVNGLRPQNNCNVCGTSS